MSVMVTSRRSAASNSSCIAWASSFQPTYFLPPIVYTTTSGSLAIYFSNVPKSFGSFGCDKQLGYGHHKRLQRGPSCVVQLSRTGRSPFLEETEQFLVDLVLVGRAHAMRRAFVDLERRILDDLGREHGRSADRHDLVVVAMKDQGGHVDFLEIFSKICLGKRLDAKVRGGEAGHHSLEPERLAHAFRDLCARPVVPVERQAEILPKLRTV